MANDSISIAFHYPCFWSSTKRSLSKTFKRFKIQRKRCKEQRLEYAIQIHQYFVFRGCSANLTQFGYGYLLEWDGIDGNLDQPDKTLSIHINRRTDWIQWMVL